MRFKMGAKVQWKWLGRPILGTIKECYLEPIKKQIKGKWIKRNASSINPAYLVESEAGNLALKLQSELSKRTKSKTPSRKTPKMFS